MDDDDRIATLYVLNLKIPAERMLKFPVKVNNVCIS